MSGIESDARDGYADYYAEKLWQLVPEAYRNADGLTLHPGALRGIVEVIAAQAAETRRSIDRLWEDQHIETCDDWAVPYIADLVGARLVSARDARGRRVDVANAIYFRRRRGTPDVLDTLVRAMSGWDVILVEGFRRLARMRHRLDALPIPQGIFTETLPGGTADLRRPVGADIADGPFSEFFFTLDTRLLRGQDGRFGIRKLNFHLFRLKAYVMEGVDPVELEDPDALGLLRTFTVDPSGRDIPLFIDGEPPERDGAASTFGESSRPCRAPPEWTITQSIRCRLLCHVAYEITSSIIIELSQLATPPLAADEEAMTRALGTRFDSEPAMRRRLIDLGASIAIVLPDWYVELVHLSLVEECGKAQLYPEQVEIRIGPPGTEAIKPHHMGAADLSDRTCQPVPLVDLEELWIDPERGRFATVPPGVPVNANADVLRYVYGFSGDVGAGPYPRTLEETTTATASNGVVPNAGVFQGDGLTIIDNRTYELSIVSATPVPDAALLAESELRPYVLLSGDAGNLRGANLLAQAEGQTFVIDGGWYGSNDPNFAGTPADFVFMSQGLADTALFDWDTVEIKNATFDPGGMRGDGINIPTLRIRVRAQIRRLVIRRSIVGPIEIVRDLDSPLANVQELIICDSIVDASKIPGARAISCDSGTVTIESSTVFGDVYAHVLRASTSIVVGEVNVINNQDGCFRFSASISGPNTRLPPRYRDYLGPIPHAYFGSFRFGDPSYARLSIVAPPEIAQGAEDGSEMGAFSHLLTPIRMQSVRAKLDEFGPAGMIAQFLFHDDEMVVAALHAGPISIPPPVITPPPPPSPGAVIPAPPPPAPPPLPQSCEGDPAGEVVDVAVEPPGEVVPGSVVITPAEFEVSGWRSGYWRADNLPTTTVLEAVPFDPVEVMFEYDARFGTLPRDQRWSAIHPDLEVKDGALVFEVGPEKPFRFVGERDLVLRYPTQIHAHATVELHSKSEDPARVGRVERGRDNLHFALAANEAGEKRRGLRIGVPENAAPGIFHLMKLDGDPAERILDPRDRSARPLRGWQTYSLHAHFSANAARATAGGHVEREPLDAFGQLDVPRSSSNQGPELNTALIFMAPEGTRLRARILNVVASAPGRFARAWVETECPANDPQLTLHFQPPKREDPRSTKFLIRYGAHPAGAVPRIPEGNTLGTLRTGRGFPKLELTVKLRGLRKGARVWITVERVPEPRDPILAETLLLTKGILSK